MKLFGWMGKLPIWIPKLDNLAKVILCDTRLEDGAIDALQELPNLILLRLWVDAYVGAKLIFGNNAFQKLRVLMVSDLANLQEVHFQEHSLPQLETLEIELCQLKVGITDIKHLLKLRTLVLGYRVYVANMDVVQKQVDEHCNRPMVEVTDPRFQRDMEESYQDEQSEAETETSVS